MPVPTAFQPPQNKQPTVSPNEFKNFFGTNSGQPPVNPLNNPPPKTVVPPPV